MRLYKIVIRNEVDELMEPMREIGKLQLVAGGVLVVLGALLMLGPKLPLRLGRLPGDIVWQGRNTTSIFPS